MDTQKIKAHLSKHWRFWLIFVAAILFGIFIWPTPYRYEKLHNSYPSLDGGSSGYDTIYRVNRLTGEAKVVRPRS